MKRLTQILVLILVAIALVMICTGEAFSQNNLVDNKNWKSSDTPAEVKIRVDLKNNIAKMIFDVNGEITEIESEYVYSKYAQTLSLFTDNGQEVAFGMKFKDNGETMELLFKGEHLAYFGEVHYFTIKPRAYQVTTKESVQKRTVQPQNERKSLFNDGSFLNPYLEQYYGTSDPRVLKQIYEMQQNTVTPAPSSSSSSSYKKCLECGGSGWCIVCEGVGRYSKFGISSVCITCNGNKKCTRCNGSKHE